MTSGSATGWYGIFVFRTSNSQDFLANNIFNLILLNMTFFIDLPARNTYARNMLRYNMRSTIMLTPISVNCKAIDFASAYACKRSRSQSKPLETVMNRSTRRHEVPHPVGGWEGGGKFSETYGLSSHLFLWTRQ